VKFTSSAICILLLIAAGLLAYLNSFSNEFVWDDKLLIENNENLGNPSYLTSVFTGTLFPGSDSSRVYYRPIQMFTYILDFFLWAKEPFGYHLTSFILHLINAFLVFYLCLLLLGEKWKSLFVALVFCVHPAFVPIVAYVSGRADLLGFLFCLLAVYTALKYIIKEKRPIFIWLACFFYVLALLSKEYYAITPLFVLLYLFVNRDEQKMDKAIKVFFSISILIFLSYVFFRLKVVPLPKAGEAIAVKSFAKRLAVFPYIITNYVITLIFPVNLSMEKKIIYSHFREARFILSYLTPAFIAAMLFYFYKRKRKVELFWLGWFVVGILPVSNLFVPLNHLWANHWTYVASLGFFGFLLLSIDAMGKRLANAGLFGKIKVILFVFIICILTLITVRENRYWRDEHTLFSRIMEKNPHATNRLTFNMAKLYEEKKDYKKALELYTEAINRGVGRVDRLYDARAVLYRNMGDLRKARPDFEEAVRLQPDVPRYRTNLGTIYAELGMIDKARGEWKAALELDPGNEIARRNLSLLP